jgi:hypothetical protein
MECTNTGGVTATIAATSTTGLVDGQLLYLFLQKNAATGSITATWNSQYEAGNMPAGATTVAATQAFGVIFVWRSASSKWAFLQQASQGANSAIF